MSQGPQDETVIRTPDQRLRVFVSSTLGELAEERRAVSRAVSVTARRVLLDGLARDADIVHLVSELALLHPRNNTFPGEVFLHLAADALNWCGASRADPLPLEGLGERFLARVHLSRPANHEAPVRGAGRSSPPGGTEPDLLDEVAWWQTDDFWQYALFAAVAYIRAAASRTGVPVRQACQDLAQRPGHPAP